MSENIGIGSYKDLSNGADTIRSASENLKSGLSDGNSSVSRLQNPRVLEGPIGDHINGIWKIVNNTTANNISTFEQSATTLNKVEDNYHATDNKSSNDVGGVI
jgi:uncharacterized protein YukE